MVKHLPVTQETWVGKILWRRKWKPTPVFLPGESHGQRSLAGYSLWVTKSRTRLSDFTSPHLHSYLKDSKCMCEYLSLGQCPEVHCLLCIWTQPVRALRRPALITLHIMCVSENALQWALDIYVSNKHVFLTEKTLKRLTFFLQVVLGTLILEYIRSATLYK